MAGIADVSWRLYDNLSLGLTTDYIITPFSRTIAATPFGGLAEQKLHPGNSSIGMTLSMHL